jgi:DNA-binding MarR family transcriptional regulator
MPVTLRSSQALNLWRDVTERMVSGRAASQSAQSGDAAAPVRDLTQRQLAILLIVYLEPPPHTVRALAARLNVSKPVITRALDTMGDAGLIDRHRDPADGRNVLIRRTVGGSLHLESLSSAIVAVARGLPL